MAIIPSTLNTGLSAEQVMEAFDNALTHVPGTSTPAMDGTGAAGTADTFSRSDHVHPSDTSKQNAISSAAPIASECVSPMTGYSKSSSSTPGAISTSDTLNAAIGKLEKRTDLNENNILFTATIGKCESTGGTANKVVTVSDVNYTPHKGSIIAVKFKYSNNVIDTVEHPITLNVNNTGAYRIWYKNGDYVNASQYKIFGLSGYYIYYMYDGVDRWVWINYCMDNTYSLMPQTEASAGTATNERLISAKVLSNTIDEKLITVETALSGKQDALGTAQLAAVNSGINSDDVDQITTNKNNISKQQDTTAQGGNGYAIINGKRLYMTDSEPATGRIGDIWLYGNNIYQYTAITNIANVSIEQGTFNTDGGESPNNKRVRTTFDTNIYPKGAYTVTITGANDVLMFVYDSNKTCIQAEGSGGWNALPYSFELSGDRYVRFAFRKTNDGDISPSDVSNYALAFTGWYK